MYNAFVCIICVFAAFLSGCKGSAGKKAAKEALELIEKRGASKAASTVEREASQIERATSREAERANTGRRSSFRPRHSSYDEDESYYQPKVYSVQCSQCGGSGIVCQIDYYGNIQFDYYGNPIMGQCPNCGGSGSILVSE